MRLFSLLDYQKQAQKKLSNMAYAYYAGGARDEITLHKNRQAWDQIDLHYRVLVDVQHRTTHTRILNQEVHSPILIAPTAFHGLAHPQGECATIKGSSQANQIYIASTLSNRSIEEISAISNQHLWFQLYVYKDRALTLKLIEKAETAGCKALVLTVDAAEIGTRERDQATQFHLPNGLTLGNLRGTGKAEMNQTSSGSSLSEYVRTQLDPSLTWKDLKWLIQQTSLPVLVKGIVRVDDACRAVECGAHGVVVSNHGGRQLDTAPSTASVLPKIVQKVGSETTILVDGGIRRGTDVVKALALGAHGVLVGRPILWGLAVNGSQGVYSVLDLLNRELLEVMALCGCPTLESISLDLIHPYDTPSSP